MDSFSFDCLLACSDSAAPAPRVSVAAITAGGVFVAIVAAFVKFRALRRWQLILSFTVLSGIVAMLVPAYERGREASRAVSCRCNLTQIALALQTYADIYKSFPPAYITDANGNRMHSWRVLILPFLDQQQLYDRYDFDEPWNGPHNRQLSQLMPPFYRCPSDDIARPGETSYATIDGPGAAFSANRGSTLDAFKDGRSKTLGVVEAVGTGIDWLEPRDVPFSTLKAGLMPSVKGGIASRHEGICVAAFCDGHTTSLKSSISPTTLQALATRSGGEQVSDDVY